MDAQAKKKALFRAKLNAQKKDKRIDSPLVRYNESDQPVCRVCNVVLKSESYWEAHQASRKHQEAIANLKANAAGVNRANNVKSESSTGTTTNQSQQSTVEPSANLSKSRITSGLPPNFFDNSDIAKQKTDSVKSVPLTVASAENSQPLKQISGPGNKPAKGALPEGFFDKGEAELVSPSVKPATEPRHSSEPSAGLEIKQVVKGALPEGFFDNKDADLLARGIKPVKPDIKDEYKEFEKLIQEDLQVMDNRMEEEEMDAAYDIEEEEQVEQRSCMERVEMLKRKKTERDATWSAKRKKVSDVSPKKQKVEDSTSSDDDEDGNFSVDWRAQHF